MLATQALIVDPRDSVSGDPYTIDLLCSLFDGSSMCIARLDVRLDLLDSNAAFLTAFGLRADALSGRGFLDLVHSSAREKLFRQFQSLLRDERSRFGDRVLAGDGNHAFTAAITGLTVTDDADRVESLIVLLEPEEAPATAVTRLARMKKPLTKMDALVLEGVAAGMSTVQLAANLFLSRGGVEYHVSTLMKNLRASNRSALVSKAYAAGLFSLGSWPPRVVPEFVE